MITSSKPLAAFMIMAALMASTAFASVLDISADQSKLRVNNTISALDSVFNITEIDHFYVYDGDSFSMYRIVFLENLDKLGIMRKQMSTMEGKVASSSNLSATLSDMIEYKKNDNLQLGARLDSLEKETIILSNQSNQTSLMAESLRNEAGELESRISGNFLVSPGQTSALLVVFTLLIAAIIAIEFKAYFRTEKKESESKTDSKAEKKA